jgi:FG-GAP-like repeat
MSHKKYVESVEGKTSFGRIFPLGIVALLAVGVFGAVGSNLNLFGGSSVNPTARSSAEITAQTQNSATRNSATQNSATPPTSATPTLSKEYIYAGSRMLAVEDANANAAPPADLAVWRPANGVFYVLGGTGSQQTFFQWGVPTDRPAPGDYDGDGKTDFAIFRPSSGQWWVVKSSDNTSFAMQFGASCTTTDTANCDKIAQADFDGDGKTDAAVFRPTSGVWYILPSSGGSYYGVPFGLGTDIPAPADYDGDGRADVGVWRDSNATFYSTNSGNGVLSTAIMSSSTAPVSADYDGDGRADYAIRSGNSWIIRNSSTGQTQTIPWQTAGEIAVQNDYDGDGKVDIATWNSSTGNWFIRQSGSNNLLRQVSWGTAGDIPVPAFYRR